MLLCSLYTEARVASGGVAIVPAADEIYLAGEYSIDHYPRIADNMSFDYSNFDLPDLYDQVIFAFFGYSNQFEPPGAALFSQNQFCMPGRTEYEPMGLNGR